MQLSNRNSGRWLDGASVCGPLVVLALILVGVTAPPALDVGEQRAALAHARVDLTGLEHERSRYRELSSAGGAQLAREAEQRARAVLPSHLPPALVHGAVRAAAREAGVSLEGLDVGHEIDLGISDGARAVRAIGARVSGKARPSQIVELVEALQGLGFPTAVLEFNVGRARADTVEFEFRAELGLLYRVDIPADESVPLDGDLEQEWNE